MVRCGCNRATTSWSSSSRMSCACSRSDRARNAVKPLISASRSVPTCGRTLIQVPHQMQAARRADRLRQRWMREGVGRRGSARALAQNLPQNGVEDTTVAEELDLGGGVDPHAGGEGETLAGGADGFHLDEAAWVQSLPDAAHVEDLVALQAKRGGVLPVFELERQHAHPHQVRAVDAFVAH